MDKVIVMEILQLIVGTGFIIFAIVIATIGTWLGKREGMGYIIIGLLCLVLGTVTIKHQVHNKKLDLILERLPAVEEVVEKEQ